MALTKTRAEIKAVLPRLVSTLNDTSLLPNFERAEYKYIVPIIGPTLYTALTTYYETLPFVADADKDNLLKKIRLVAVAYAYKDEIGLANLTITETGARKLTQGGSDRVYGWEYQELKNTLLDAAFDGTEVLLNYLFNTKATWGDWTTSDQYADLSSLLIKTGTDFNKHYTLFQPQRNYWTMRSVMADVQELWIQEAIGNDLLIYLRDKPVPTTGEAEAIRMLKKALSFLTVCESCKSFSVMFTDGGFTILGQKNNSTIEPGAAGATDLSLLDMKTADCSKKGNDFLAKARFTLVALYGSVDATVDFKTAFETGPLTGFVQPADRESGNATRHFFGM